MEKCKICNREFKNKKSLSTHVNHKHNINGKQYYDEYLKKDNEGNCVVCGNETTYRGMGVGYLENCSQECRDKNKELRKKRSEVAKGKKQSIEHIQKRIKNTNQIEKEKTRKKTVLKKYGVDNVWKLDSVKKIISEKSKGRKNPRTEEWQNKIIESKRNNGTLKHTKKTKEKIKNTLKKYFKKDTNRSKYIPKNTNKRHISGWYNDIFFRSSLELSFLINNSSKELLSCETKEYGITYQYKGKRKIYYPDFTDGEFIYEIKPSTMLKYKDNKDKITVGKEKYGEKFKVITEKESPYVSKEKIFSYISEGIVKLCNHSSIILEEKYKH